MPASGHVHLEGWDQLLFLLFCCMQAISNKDSPLRLWLDLVFASKNDLRVSTCTTSSKRIIIILLPSTRVFTRVLMTSLEVVVSCRGPFLCVDVRLMQGFIQGGRRRRTPPPPPPFENSPPPFLNQYKYYSKVVLKHKHQQSDNCCSKKVCNCSKTPRIFSKGVF